MDIESSTLCGLLSQHDATKHCSVWKTQLKALPQMAFWALIHFFAKSLLPWLTLFNIFQVILVLHCYRYCHHRQQATVCTKIYTTMANSESINGNIDMIDNEITHEILENIIEAIDTICLKIRPNVNSIFEYLNKELYD